MRRLAAEARRAAAAAPAVARAMRAAASRAGRARALLRKEGDYWRLGWERAGVPAARPRRPPLPRDADRQSRARDPRRRPRAHDAAARRPATHGPRRRRARRRTSAARGRSRTPTRRSTSGPSSPTARACRSSGACSTRPASETTSGGSPSAEGETDALTREIARSLGLQSRGRDSRSPIERARVSATRAIRVAIRLIQENDRASAATSRSRSRPGRSARTCPTPSSRWPGSSEGRYIVPPTITLPQWRFPHATRAPPPGRSGRFRTGPHRRCACPGAVRRHAPANKCVAEKVKCVAKAKSCLLQCHEKALRHGTAVDPTASPSAATVSRVTTPSPTAAASRSGRSSAAAARASATPAPSPRGSRRTSARSCTGSSRAARRRIPARPRRSCASASTTPACCARFGRPPRPAPPSAASTSAAATSTGAAELRRQARSPLLRSRLRRMHLDQARRASPSTTRARSASRTTPSSTT